MTCSRDVLFIAVVVALVLCSAQRSSGAKHKSCQFAVLAPRQMRTETATHVVVTSYRGKCTLDVILRPLGSPKTELTRKIVTLRRNGIRAVRLNLREADVRTLQQSHHPHQVELVVVASGDPDPVVRTLDLDPHPGYLMVQTDKPVYTPGQTVHYRAIALNEQEKWVRWEVHLTMRDAGGLAMPLRRGAVRARRAFQWQSFPLPDHASPGTWRLSAAFLSPGARTTHSAMFEVKHYALPVFSVEVVTSPRLILDSSPNVTVVIRASYSFGKPVEGTATALLQLWCDGDVSPLTNFSHVLKEGVATLTHNVTYDLFLAAQRCHLQVKAEVTESLTNQKQRVTSRSSIFTSTPYVITEGGNRRYFRERLPFHFSVKVKDVLGEPLAYGLLRGTLHSPLGDLDLGENLTDSRGQATFTVDGDLTSDLTRFTLSVESDVTGLRPDQQARLDWPGAVRVDSSRLPFLQLSCPSPAQEDVPITLTLLYNPGKKRNLILVVWTRGRCVFKKKIRGPPSGKVMYQIPAKHARKMYPSAFVLAYYFHHRKAWSGDVDTTVVSDSLHLDLGHDCGHKINISTTTDVTPRSKHTLTVKGSPGTVYALWAVDNSVYLVNPSRAVSREKVFEAFSEYHQRTCDFSPNMADGFEEKCFHLVTNVDQSSASRASGPDALAADQASWWGDWTGEEDWRSSPVYQYFPESLLFLTGTLSKDGTAEVNVTYPDSLTTWAVTAMGVAPKGGLCVTPPLLVSANQIFSVSLEAPPTLRRLETGRLVLRVVNADMHDMRGNIRMTTEDDVLCWESPDDGRFNDVSFRRNDVTVWPVDIFPIAVGRHKVRVAVDITVMRHRPVRKLDFYVLEKEVHVLGEGEVRKKLFKALVYPHIPVSRDPNRSPGSSEEVLKTGNRRKRSVDNNFEVPNHDEENCELQNDGFIINEVECEGGAQTIMVNVAPPVGSVPESVQVTASLSGLLHHSPDEVDAMEMWPAEAALIDVSLTLHAVLALSDSHAHQAARENAVSHLTEGITSLLGFRLKNGAFSLTDNGTACAWLTALAVSTLCRSRDHVQVEQDVWRPGLAWVQERTRNLLEIPAHELRPSPLSEKDQFLKLTTDILLAAHYCGEMMEADEFITAVSSLSGHLTSSLAPAVLGHVAFGLAELTHEATSLLSGVSMETQTRLLRFANFFANKSRDLLMTSALTTSSGMLHWSADPEVEDESATSTPLDEATALDIEATAFGLLTLLRHETDVRDLANVFRWLVEKRQPDGFFVGSVDTMAASQALAEFHRRGTGDVTDISVSMAEVLDSASLDPLQWLYQDFDESLEEDLPLADPADVIALSGTSVNVGLTEPTEIASIDRVEVPSSRRLQFRASGSGMAILTVELTYSVDVDLSPPGGSFVPLATGNPSSLLPHAGDVILGQGPVTAGPGTAAILETTEAASTEGPTLGQDDVVPQPGSSATLRLENPNLAGTDGEVRENPMKVPHDGKDLKTSTRRAPIAASGGPTISSKEKSRLQGTSTVEDNMKSENAEVEQGQPEVTMTRIKQSPTKKPSSQVRKETLHSPVSQDKPTKATQLLTPTTSSKKKGQSQGTPAVEDNMKWENAEAEHGQPEMTTTRIKQSPTKKPPSQVRKETLHSAGSQAKKPTKDTQLLTDTATPASVDTSYVGTRTPILLISDYLEEKVLTQSQTPDQSETSTKDGRLWRSDLVTHGANIEIDRGDTDLLSTKSLTPEKESGTTINDVITDGAKDVNCGKHHIDVKAKPANVLGQGLCGQCGYDCEEEDSTAHDHSDDSNHVSCKRTNGNQATLTCVEVCISKRLEELSEFQTSIHLQQGFCLYNASDLYKLKSRSSVQEVKVMNGTDVFVASTQAFCVRFRQITWDSVPHEPGVVHVTDTKTGRADCVHSYHGGHDRDRHTPAFCHDVTSTPIGQCHCLQKSCPQTNVLSIAGFMEAIDSSSYVHYLEFRSVRRGSVIAHVEFSLKVTYKDFTARALNASHVNTTVRFTASLKCLQDFLAGHAPTQGQGYWVMGKLVHKMSDFYVYAANRDVVVVRDRWQEEQDRAVDCRRRNYLRSAISNKRLLREPPEIEICSNPRGGHRTARVGTT